MKSPQEILLKEISNRSVGSDYVFEPEEYRKGNAIREPADLVWVCNKCIILMYMAQRKHKRREPAAHVRVRDEMINHNIRQAKGWLSEWRNNKAILRGHSKRISFAYTASDIDNVIIISVLDCGTDEAIYHPEFTQQLNVAVCATVSQHALLELARVGGGFLDILDVLYKLVLQHINGAPVVSASELIAIVQKEALIEADPDRIWLSENAEATTVHVQTMLSVLRAPNPEILSPSTAPWTIGGMLNDMCLADLYSITVFIRSGINAVGPELKHFIVGIIRTKSAHWLSIHLVTTLSSNFLESATSPPALDKCLEEDYLHRGAISIVWDTAFNQPIVVSYKSESKNSATYAEEFILRIRKATKI